MNETKTHTIIPAQAGWFVRYFIKGTKEYEAYLGYEPIVAWEIERFDRPYHPSAGRPATERCVTRFAMPVLLHGGGMYANPYVFQDPSGMLHAEDGPTFNSDEEAIAYFEEEAIRQSGQSDQ
ncbi:hypothetical protein V3589_03120 [Sinorhizobium fredii]|uniref:hypothetical protein n=1 Tax=Rhizobium fredii TaxID=380 RepID=UPI00309D064B